MILTGVTMTARPSGRAYSRATYDASLETPSKMECQRTNSSKLPPSSFRGTRSLVVHGLLLCLAAIFFCLWIKTMHYSCPLDPLLIYSPANEAIQYVEKKFDGNLNSTSAFRGDPGPAIDAAWRRVGINVPATRLTRQQFLMVGGYDSSAVVKFRPEDGGGYMSQIDAYHHMHCLDMLRKQLRQDYYAPLDPSFNAMLRPHLGHCVELIRQKLMCTSDLTMVKYDWIPGFDRPQPNLSTTHQCVDYEHILDWSARHSARVLASHVVKFGNATELPDHLM